MEERFPDLMPWSAPKGSGQQYLVFGGVGNGGYSVLCRGVVECLVCHARFVHDLRWPDEAWWQWPIRGRLLWAWDRDHALQIRDYVSATHRPARGLHGPLGRIPSEFLAAKVRESVVKAIDRSLLIHGLD